MAKIINLTPHAINVGDTFIETSGEIARVSSSSEKIGEVNGIPVNRSVYGSVTGLPAPSDDVFYVVSVFVLNAAKAEGRSTSDLLVPDDLVRDREGRIVGCRAFRTL